MKPTLLAWQIAGSTIALPTYGVMVTLGFVAGIALVVRDGRGKFPADALLDLCWWILVASLAGSRLWFVLQNLGDFAARVRAGDWLAPLRLWDGGLVFFGGGLAAAGVIGWFVRRRGWSFLQLADLLAPAVVIGHALGRIGCFAAGCCFGQLCPPGGPCVQFPAGSVAHDQLVAQAAGSTPGPPLTPPLYPTQLFEAAALLVLFVLLRLARRRQRRVPAFPGQIFLLYLTGYSILRFGLELYRAEAARSFLFTLPLPALARALGLPAEQPLLLSTSQLVSALLLAAGLGGLLLARKTRAPA